MDPRRRAADDDLFGMHGGRENEKEKEATNHQTHLQTGQAAFSCPRAGQYSRPK